MSTADNPGTSTAPNASTAMARVLVDELVRCGMTDAVLSPGSRSTALALALDGHDRVRLHVTLDERSAAFVAIGLARATHRAAAVLTTSGSAVANLHPGVIEAHHGFVPLLLLTADRPPELRATAANQTIDQTGIFGTAARWFFDPGVPRDEPGANGFWRSVASQAWARAHGAAGPPGPVHLNLPFVEPTVPHTDDGRSIGAPFGGSLDGRRDGRPWTTVRRSAQSAPVEAERIADLIRAAEQPLLLLGAGTYAPAPVVQLARAASMPLVAEPLSCARRGASGIAHASVLVAAGILPPPDLVIRVGRTGVSRAVESWLTAEIPQLLVDAHGNFLDPRRTIGEVVVADPDACLALAASLLRENPPDDDDRLEAWKSADALLEGILDEVLGGGRASGPGVARSLVAGLPVDTALVLSSSAPVRDVDAYAPLREDLWMTGNRGASGIDGFTSTSLGVALGWPGPTVALAGDLSLLHDTNGWLLRPDGVDADLVMVVVDNDGGGLFHQLPIAREPAFERLFATPHGVDLGALVRAHGVEVVAVDTNEDVVAAVAAGIAAGGRHLVHVRTDRAHDADLRRAVHDRARGLGPLPR